jgi:hypothetical protein
VGDKYTDYTAKGRLQDVLALIQILGLDPKPRQTEKEPMEALQCAPRSKLPRWSDVVAEHPEFFRVAGKDRNSVSLAARHAAGNSEAERILSTDFIQRLMQTAIDIHDREAKRAEKWTLYLPLVIAIIGALGSIATAIVGILASRR